MAEHFRYDFLKLEFRPLYDEIQEEINKAASMDTVFGIQNILISLVACIYNSNKIYQNKELAFNERLKELNDINLLEGNIEKKILSLYENKEVAEPEVVLYEILVWLAITYGCEDYSLILQSLNDREKDIFAQELKRKKITFHFLIMQFLVGLKDDILPLLIFHPIVMAQKKFFLIE